MIHECKMLMRVETGEGVHGNSIILAICLYICKTVKKINSLSLKNFLETKQGSYFIFFSSFLPVRREYREYRTRRVKDRAHNRFLRLREHLGGEEKL